MRAFICILLGLLLFSNIQASEEPSTSDFDFLLGNWKIEAANGDFTRTSNGTATCEYMLREAFISCDMHTTYDSGNTYQMMSLHNYNAIYGHHETLYISSSRSWPIKVLGPSKIEHVGDEIHWTNEFEFKIQDGNTEWVRGEMIVTENTIQAKEFIKRTGEDAHDWRLEYNATWTRIQEE